MPELHSEGDPFDDLDHELPPAAIAAHRGAEWGALELLSQPTSTRISERLRDS